MSETKGFRPNVKEFECRESASLVDTIAWVAGDLAPLDLIELGSVYVEDTRILNPAHQVQAGDLVRIHASPRRFRIPPDLGSRIVEETEDRIVVEKPAGFPSEPTVDNLIENLVSAVSDLRGQTLHLVNSLETESSGLVILAKSLEAQREWKRAFNEDRIGRRFNVFTENSIPPGSYSGFEVKACEENSGETNAIADGRVEWRIEGPAIARYHRLEIVLGSGRPAKLREALADAGAPILGDRKNGSRHLLVDPQTGRAAMALRQTGF